MAQLVLCGEFHGTLLNPCQKPGPTDDAIDLITGYAPFRYHHLSVPINKQANINKHETGDLFFARQALKFLKIYTRYFEGLTWGGVRTPTRKNLYPPDKNYRYVPSLMATTKRSQT